MFLEINSNMQTLITVIGGAIATTLLGGIWKGISAINAKIEKVLMDNLEHKTIIDNHKVQFIDLWDKTKQIDDHLQSTDKNIAALQERTKNINSMQ